MNASPIAFMCVSAALALAACKGDAMIEPVGPRVLVATPPANAPYEALLGKAGEACLVEGETEGETETGGAGDGESTGETGGETAGLRAGQPIVVRHRLDPDLVARQQALRPEVVLETVCMQQKLDHVAYASDGELIKPAVAPLGAECGLIVTLRVAELETRCEIPADGELCDVESMPCSPEAASSSGGSSGGSSSAGETDGPGEATAGTTSGTSG